MIFALFNLENLNFLAYSFRDSKCFAFLIWRLNVRTYSFRDPKCFALIF